MRNLVLSAHRLNKLEVCPRLFFFEHVLNKKPAETPKYFLEGGYVHKILEGYYGAKALGVEIDIVEYARSKAIEFSGLTIEETEILIKLFLEYSSFHSNETWEIQGVEVPFARTLFESEEYDLKLVITGTADLLVKSKEGIEIVVDHKVVSQNRAHYERDNQVLLYCWATNRRDFIINQLGKQKTLPPKDKFRRQYFNVTEALISEWKESTIFKALELAKYHSENYYPHRYSSCNFQGRKCTFFEVCNTDQSNWQYKLEDNFITEVAYDAEMME